MAKIVASTCDMIPVQTPEAAVSLYLQLYLGVVKTKKMVSVHTHSPTGIQQH